MTAFCCQSLSKRSKLHCFRPSLTMNEIYWPKRLLEAVCIAWMHNCLQTPDVVVTGTTNAFTNNSIWTVEQLVNINPKIVPVKATFSNSIVESYHDPLGWGYYKTKLKSFKMDEKAVLQARLKSPNSRKRFIELVLQILICGVFHQLARRTDPCKFCIFRHAQAISIVWKVVSKFF